MHRGIFDIIINNLTKRSERVIRIHVLLGHQLISLCLKYSTTHLMSSYLLSAQWKYVSFSILTNFSEFVKTIKGPLRALRAPMGLIGSKGSLWVP